MLAKKVCLSCGRWIGKLVPSVQPVLKGVRQVVSYWRMKQPEKYQLGVSPCWTHFVDN